MSADSINELRAAVIAAPLPFPTNGFLNKALKALDKRNHPTPASASTAEVLVNIAASKHTVEQTSSNGIAEEVDNSQGESVESEGATTDDDGSEYDPDADFTAATMAEELERRQQEDEYWKNFN